MDNNKTNAKQSITDTDLNKTIGGIGTGSNGGKVETETSGDRMGSLDGILEAGRAVGETCIARISAEVRVITDKMLGTVIQMKEKKRTMTVELASTFCLYRTEMLDCVDQLVHSNLILKGRLEERGEKPVTKTRQPVPSGVETIDVTGKGETSREIPVEKPKGKKRKGEKVVKVASGPVIVPNPGVKIKTARKLVSKPTAVPPKPEPKTSGWKEVPGRKVRRTNKDPIDLIVEEANKAGKQMGYTFRPVRDPAATVVPGAKKPSGLTELWEHLKAKNINPKFSKVVTTGENSYYLVAEDIDTKRALDNSGLNIRTAGSRKPRITVHMIGDEIGDDDVARALEEQGESPVPLEKGWHEKLVLIPRKVQRKTRRGRDLDFEVPPDVAGALVGRTMRVGLSRCRVGPRVDVLRCHRCQRYGHIGSACKAPSVVCSRCAGPHHALHCVKGSGPPKCISCTSAGFASDHASGDTARCRVWERLFRREARKFSWKT